MPTGVVKRGRGRPRSSASSSTINNFTKVSKKTKLSTKKETAINATLISTPSPSTPTKSTRTSMRTLPTTPVAQTTQSSRKRKADPTIDENEATSHIITPAKTSTVSTSKHTSKRARRTVSPSVPRQQEPIHPKFERASSTDSDLSTASSVLEKLRLSQCRSLEAYTTPDTSDSEFDDLVLPQELVDIVSLFSSFLKTIALHSGYNDGGAVDTKNLFPDMARSWGRRAITVDDLRLLVGLVDYKGAPQNVFKLLEFGRNRIQVEVAPSALPFKTTFLNSFECTLKSLWYKEQNNYFDARAFITALPRANVTKKPIVHTLMPRKGQQTLEAFNKAVTEKKTKEAEIAKAKKEALAPKTPSQTLSVLDRIRLKQTVAAELAAQQPSPEQTARWRCLQRVADVASVLIMLCTSSTAMGGPMARVSYPIATVLEKLKDSMRTSISPDEAREVLRLISVEIAPQWIKVLAVSGKEHIVMMKGFMPGRAEVERRVQNRMN